MDGNFAVGLQVLEKKGNVLQIKCICDTVYVILYEVCRICYRKMRLLFYRTDASGKFLLEAMAANRCDEFYYSGVNVLRGGAFVLSLRIEHILYS